MNNGILQKSFDTRNITLKSKKYYLNFPNLNNIHFLLKIICFIFSISISKGSQRSLIISSSEIHMIIKGNGTQNLLNESFYKKPSEVLVNSIKKESCKTFCDMEYEENNITLIFNDYLYSSENMFFGLDNLIEIDLSLFDFSQITTMENMFRNCYNLEKIYFGNINTVSVVNMGHLFYNCKSLIYLDVSKFDTSKVYIMEKMFYNCTSLSEINLSNFNTSKVESLRIFFYNCHELTYIDLSNFNTSFVTDMQGMFYNCSNLSTINLTNFKTSKVKTFSSMFYNCSKLTSIDISNFDTSSAKDISYMFYNCSSLLSIDLTNFNTTNVESIRSLFYNCHKLTTLNVSNFDTSKVSDMQYFFYGCSSLESIDLSNFNIKNIESLSAFFYKCQSLTSLDISFFDTSKIKDFSYLFYGCSKLKSLNLTKFNTSSAENMEGLFSYCHNLESLDLINFDTSSVTAMDGMFYSCYSLKMIKFPEIFNTSQVKSMKSMFYECESLISLNLSSFDTTKVSNMGYMFSNCYNLKYLDIQNFSPINLEAMHSIFYNLSSLIYLNINSLEINRNTKLSNSFQMLPSDLKICSNKTNMSTYLSNIEQISNCSDVCFIKNIKIDLNKRECIHSCKDNGYNYECNNICYNECPEDTHIIIRNLSNKDNIFVEYENGVAICLDRNPEGYYLNKDGFYEECYERCKFCYDKGNEKNNSCIQCKSGYKFIYDMKYNTNCYKICQYYYYFNENDDYICTENGTCPEIYNKLIPEEFRCINKCENDYIYKYEYNNICYRRCPEGTKYKLDEKICIEENNIIETTYNNLINETMINRIIESDYENEKSVNLNEILTSEIISENEFNYDINNYKNESIDDSTFENIKENHLLKNYQKVKNGNDIEVETKNSLITMTNTHNQKNNIYKNKTTVDLGECETELIKNYNISENASLYILKIDKREEGMKIPKIEYEVYYPLNGTDLDVLDLTICKNKNLKIDISIPIEINDNDIDKYNPESNYYNDICSKTTSDSGTDISLSDRKNKFIDDNMTLCEEDCKLVQYNSTTKKAKCSCLVKINILSIKDIKFDKDKLKDNFIDINNIANIKLMKCFKKVFSKDNLIKNYGFYIFSFIYILYIICLLLFCCKYYSQLIKEIDKVIKAKENTKNSGINFKKNIETQNNRFIKIKKPIKKNQKFKMPIIIKKNGNPPKNGKIRISKKIKLKTNFNIGSKNQFINTKNNISKIRFSSKNENILKYNDRELNSLTYKKALIFDKRTYFQYYISLLKINHLLIFSFYNNNKDYNSQIIKMFLFFFFFAVHFTINALFFNDDTMHTIYIEEGEFNFIYQIPIIVYSSLISGVINTIIKYFALSESIIIEIKHKKVIKDFERIRKEMHNKIKCRFALFFLISFVLLLFFMYYISCFCGVYINTQIHLIKDTMISFVLSLIYPFGLFLIPGIFRIPALNSKDKKQECLYKFSNLLESLLV